MRLTVRKTQLFNTKSQIIFDQCRKIPYFLIRIWNFLSFSKERNKTQACSRNKLPFAHHQKKHFGFLKSKKTSKTWFFLRCFCVNVKAFSERVCKHKFVSGTYPVLFAAFHHKSDVNFLILFCYTKPKLYLDFKYPPPIMDKYINISIYWCTHS